MASSFIQVSIQQNVDTFLVYKLGTQAVTTYSSIQQETRVNPLNS